MKFSKKLIILSIILLIYVITIGYKFIGLTVLYNIANSFSENNYWMSKEEEVHSLVNNTHLYLNTDIQRENNTYLKQIYASDKQFESYANPNMMLYINSDKNIVYELDYNKETDQYIYSKLDTDTNEYFETNDIKVETLNSMPTNRLLFSLNILNIVSLKDRYIKSVSFEDGIKSTKYIYIDDVGLLDNIIEKSNYVSRYTSYSYDYVQDHFKDNILNPTEDDDFKDKIVFNN